jgi:hypothetical protein
MWIAQQYYWAYHFLALEEKTRNCSQIKKILILNISIFLFKKK